MSLSRRELLRLATILGVSPAALIACGADTDKDGSPNDAGGDLGDSSDSGDAGSDVGSDVETDVEPDEPDTLPQYEYDGPLGPEDLFQHGVASGDPLQEAVILWTRLTNTEEGPIDVWYEVSRDLDFTRRVDVGTISTDASVDYTVKFDATGLRPGRTYYYRFMALGRTSPIGRTRTAADGSLARLRLGVCSCASYAHGYFQAYAALARRTDLDVIVHLGDYIYEYGTGEYGSIRAYEPSNEIVTLADYRTRYGYYRRERDLQALHQQTPFITIWDDHESADNSWSGGASNHDASEGEWADRKEAARRAYSEWMPIRDQADGRIWRSFRFGDLVDLVMLDTRIWGRDEQPRNIGDDIRFDEDRQLLGADQEAWMSQQLRDSTTKWRVLGQQVMVAQLKTVGAPNSEGGGAIFNADQWDGYTAARDRLFAQIRSEAIENLVVLTGDIHSSWAFDLTEDPNNPETYNGETGEGSLGVEFVVPGISSPGFPRGIGVGFAESALIENPHLKYAELESRGYAVLDITPERVQAAYYLYEDVVTGNEPETAGGVWSVRDGENRLFEDGSAASPPDDVSAPAPADQ
jgi:alkaline phosphatase D